MKRLFLTLALVVGCLVATAAQREYANNITAADSRITIVGTDNSITHEDNVIVFDAARAGNDKGFRWASGKLNTIFGGDFIAEMDFDIQALDHWNSTGMSIISQRKDAWSISFLRSQQSVGDEVFALSVSVAGNKEPVFKQSFPIKARHFTMRIERTGKQLNFSWIDNAGETHELAQYDDAPEGFGWLNCNFGSPVATNNKTRIYGIRIKCDKVFEDAYAPSYSDVKQLDAGKILFSENAVQDSDGVWKISAHGRLIIGYETDITSQDWHLKWQSQGMLRMRVITPGISEPLQLSDNFLWDRKEHKIPEEFASRQAYFVTEVLRFSGERQWDLPHYTTSGLFFVEVAPVSDDITEPVLFANATLWGRTMNPPKPLKTLVQIETDGDYDDNGMAKLAWIVPPVANRHLSHADIWPTEEGSMLDGVKYHFNSTMLSGDCPAVELKLERYAGMLHVLHVAGAQPKKENYSVIVAGYLIVYEDGTTMPALATLRWNCGVYAAGDYDSYGFMTAGPGQGNASSTWWGPPRFGWGNAMYLPRKPYGAQWNAFYAMNLRNPHPEKKIKSLQVYQMPGDQREFMLVGLTLRAPETTVVGVVEPECAAVIDGELTNINAYEYRAVPKDSADYPLEIVKSAVARQQYGQMTLNRIGHLGAGHAAINVDSTDLDMGAAVIRVGDVESSRISLMGARNEDNPFYYMMIAGGHEGISHFDRIHRIGFDAIKVHIPWRLKDDGSIDFTDWPARFAEADKAGLKVAIRNLFNLPEQYRAQVPKRKTLRAGKITEENVYGGDTSNAFYREKLVDYYRHVGELAKAAPNVMGINANYGSLNRIGEGNRICYSDTMLQMLYDYLEKHTTVNELNARTGLKLKSFNEITPQMILDDQTGTIFAAYSRANEEVGNKLIEDISEAIRSTGCTAHLTFNVNFHPIENKLTGQCFGEYLRIGMKYPPASLFHETSERYNISFLKWLCAKRTFNLPYGDEVGQPPPTNEHAVAGYMWMGMFQCFESNYCQWWGGKPGTQNLAQLKSYHKLLYEAQYLPDPVTLALSLQTGHEEIIETNKYGLHTRTYDHYSMVNFLRELNINPDRAMIDEFPEKDIAVTSRLLMDDHTRYMPDDFADRIEKFINDGGVYLASAFSTDRKFLARFGLTVRSENNKTVVDGADTSSGKLFPVFEKAVGKGRIVVMCSVWAASWDPGRPADQRAEMLALLTRLGAFEPLVQCSYPIVYVTPYRAQNSDVLISCINVSAAPQNVTVSFAKILVNGATPKVRDLGTGKYLPVSEKGNYYTVDTTVLEINTTVLRVIAE